MAQHYFHFKRYEMGVRKDRCPDRKLFAWAGPQHLYSVEHPDMISSKTPDPILLQLIKKLKVYIDHGATQATLHESVKLLQLLQKYATTQEMSRSWSYEERTALQLLLKRRIDGEMGDTYETLLKDIAELLHINPKVAPF